MTNQEILEKAIELAIAGGWKPLNFEHPIVVDKWQDGQAVELAVLYENRDDPVSWVRELEGIIFNQNFAKALWGEHAHYDGIDWNPILEATEPPAWQYHLQAMVIADDPIKYLGENL